MANGFKHASQGSVLTQTEFEAEDIHVLDSQATGDIIYASSSSVLRRLAVGAENTTLQVSSGNIPEWVAAPTLGSGTTVGNITLANGSITDSSGAISFGDENLSTTGALSIASMGGNWTNASRTVADMGIVTTIDINGGTIDAAVIGGASAAAITGTTVTGTSLVGGTVAGTTAAFSGLITANGGITFADGDDITFTGASGTNDIVLVDDLADALSITDGSADVLTISTAGGTNTVAITGDLTVSGTIAADTAAVATTVTITDNESTDEANAIIFTSGGDLDGGNIGLESDGTLNYNPSTGTLTTTTFAGALTGNVTGNASGTAATVTSGTQASITTLANVTTVGTIGTGVWQGTAIASGYIAADAITGAKIADDAIDSEHYTDGSIDNAHLAADAVTGAKIADDAVDSEHYVDGSIDNQHIANGTIALAKTAITGGTNLTIATNALNVDDAFLINSGNDTTSGTITAAGFTAGDAGQVYFSDTAPASDHTATGVVISIASGESVAAFNSVYIRSDGEVGPADADEVAKMPAIGVALEAKGDGEATKILVAGVLRDDTYNFTPGADLFIGTTAGEITATAPSGSGDTVQKVGVALTADSIYVNFNTTEVLLA